MEGIAIALKNGQVMEIHEAARGVAAAAGQVYFLGLVGGKIDIHVRMDNERTIALYRMKGFEIEGDLRSELRIGGSCFDLYAMGLLL